MLYAGEKVYDESNFRELIGDGTRVFAGGEWRLLAARPPLGDEPHPRSFSVPWEVAGIPIPPRNEWSAMLKEQIARKARVSDYCDFPPYDQDGTPQCATEDTEVLTERGWIPWPDYNWLDLLATVNPENGVLEFQPCLQKHVYRRRGEMIYSSNRRLDFGVTPNHRMFVRRWDQKRKTLSDQYSFQLAKDLGWYVGLMHAPRSWRGTNFVKLGVPGDRVYAGDDLIALLGMVCSDGYAGGTANTKNWVGFCCFRPERRKLVELLAARLGFRELPSRPGVWVRYDAGALADWVRETCYTSRELGALNKKAPEFLRWACPRQIEIFLDYFGDQSHDEDREKVFYSSSKRMIDDLQELHLRLGKRGGVFFEDPKPHILPSGETNERPSRRYRLYASRTDSLCLDRKKHIEWDRYNGFVYCASVANGTLITRRNGSVLISGNCWANGPAQAMTIMRRIQHLPHKQISAASFAVPISGGHSGGWEGNALKYAAEHGGVSTDLWPNYSCDGSLQNRPEVIADRPKHKALKWVDCGSVFERYMAMCLLTRPGAFAYNWMSHVMCMCDGVEIEPGSFGLRVRNSWGEWGAKNDLGFAGFAVYREGHGTPDSGFHLLQVTASYN